jgi:D-arabinose 1-dehydrogenase-like Zn-dependent alcohol dehydrogenase
LDSPYQLVWREESFPTNAAPGTLICETIVSAISPGTELGAYVGLPPLRDGTGYPRVQGYCNVARVLGVGEGVQGLSAGDRVLSFSSHRSHFQIPASEVLLRLDPEMDAGHIACSYLFHLGYEAVLRVGVRAGARVVVIGMGVLGLAAVALAARSGATVTAVTEHPRAAERAQALGARCVFSRRDTQALAAAAADMVITTTNAWNDWDLALCVAGIHGRIAVLGFPGRGEPPPNRNPLDSRHFYAKQLRIEAVGMAAERPDSRGFLRFNERDNLQWLAGEIHAGRLPAEVLISGRFEAGRVEDAYRTLLAREGSPVTFLLQWTT